MGVVICSVQLARRVLQLERVNSDLRDKLQRKGEELGCIQEELEGCRELVRCSQQPGNYLLDRLKEQQEKLQHHVGVVRKMEGELLAQKEENERLKVAKNNMSADLEKLLCHRGVSAGHFEVTFWS